MIFRHWGEYMDLIRFIYGLVFFSLGFAIYLQPRRNSVYFLAKALSWLAAFALVHAFADWLLIFIPDGGSPLSRPALLLRGLGVFISFGLLLQFGLMLLVERHPKRSLLLLLPTILTAAFVWQLLIIYFAGHRTAMTFLDIKILSRYFIGLPGSLLAAWGLLLQVPALRQNRCPRVGHLYGAVVCFVLYAFVAGLVVPEGDYFLSQLLNETSFAASVGVPVEVARGLVMLGLTYFVGGLLDIFHLETERRLRTAEQDRALLREREQIGRDLHDGVMQTLYGTGLGLKQVTTLSQTNPDQVQAILTELNREIGRAIVQMRRYVQDLKEQTFSGAELTEAVRLQVLEMGQFAGLPTTFETDLVDDPDRRIPAGLREEVLTIAREGLSNIVRHSRATRASVLLGLEDDTIILRVSDDGEGFDTSSMTTGRGLESLRERVDALGGLLQIHSTPGEGTHLVAHLPLVRRLARQRTGVTNA